jgi:hypothetical protein
VPSVALRGSLTARRVLAKPLLFCQFRFVACSWKSVTINMTDEGLGDISLHSSTSQQPGEPAWGLMLTAWLRFDEWAGCRGCCMMPYLDHTLSLGATGCMCFGNRQHHKDVLHGLYKRGCSLQLYH